NKIIRLQDQPVLVKVVGKSTGHSGHCQEEGKLGRRALIRSEQHGADDGGAGPGYAGDESRGLAQTDLEGQGRRELHHVFEARLEGDLVNVEKDDTADNQGYADEHRRLEEHRLDEAVQGYSYCRGW